jgi:FkbM family methyltransferase
MAAAGHPSTTGEDFFSDLLAVVAAMPDRHRRDDRLRHIWEVAARCVVADRWRQDEPRPFGPFGALSFPFHRMGAVDSLNLFDFDELVTFAFYWANRRLYRRAVDFGANLGLHSIVMVRCGFAVRSFEPDPIHAELLARNLALNGAEPEVHRAAVSIEAGRAAFVRVLGNTTGSHLAGAKPNPYGALDRFEVAVEAAAPHLAWADLAKIDIEGHEAVLLTGLPPSTWQRTDAFVEVGSAANAAAIFAHLHGTGIRLFAERLGWDEVTRAEHMPTSHRDGPLFISARPRMPWGDG